MKFIYNALNVLIPIAAFIISVYQLIYNKEKKGLSRITKYGYAILVIALFMGLNTFLGYRVGNIEKREVDTANAQKAREYNQQVESLKGGNTRLQNKIDSLRGKINSIDSSLLKLGLVRQTDNFGQIIIVKESDVQKVIPKETYNTEKGIEILGLPTLHVKAATNEYLVSVTIRSKTTDEIYVQSEQCLLVDEKLTTVLHSSSVLIANNPTLTLTAVPAIYKFEFGKNTIPNSFFIYYSINHSFNVSQYERLKAVYKIIVSPKIQVRLVRNGESDYNRIVNYVEKNGQIGTMD